MKPFPLSRLPPGKKEYGKGKKGVDSRRVLITDLETVITVWGKGIDLIRNSKIGYEINGPNNDRGRPTWRISPRIPSSRIGTGNGESRNISFLGNRIGGKRYSFPFPEIIFSWYYPGNRIREEKRNKKNREGFILPGFVPYGKIFRD
jgi:hypothetical protein